MMMRMLSAFDTSAYLPTLSEFQLKGTDLVFSNETRTVKVCATETPLPARHFEGTAHWVGSAWAGVSGPFSGWVSADEAAVPLKINMKIFLGSVTLELEQFKRQDWPSTASSMFADGAVTGEDSQSVSMSTH